MEKRVYISVFKLEQEALDAINKLYRQGFRQDQVSVLAHNTDRFQTLYHDSATPMSRQDKKSAGDMPDEVINSGDPIILPGGAQAPGVTPPYTGVPFAAPMAGLGHLGLDRDSLLSHERRLQEGDILVVLQTDKDQEYRPDMPMIHSPGAPGLR